MAAAVRSERTRVKQAVVIVHGMGEQRPGETVNRFVRAGLPPDRAGRRGCYSRPDTVSDSFEARRLLAPAAGGRPQTEFFEFHWAHLMQGNRLDDLWPTFRRMLLTSPHRVPSGLRLLWTLAWLLILGAGWALAWGPWSDVLATGGSGPEPLLRALFGGGATAAALSYLASRVLARGLTASFVDVVRYLDTSPRSYEVRRQIRKGMIDLLQSLHDSELFGQPRYQRIIVVGHSLGAAIGYDAISYLWDRMNNVVAEDAPDRLAGLAEAEDAAARLRGSAGRPPGDREVDDFQAAQRRLWQGLREQGNPWRVTDLVTVGTPMYFADRLYTRDRDEFDRRVERGELPVCPPIPDPDLHPAPDPAIPPDRLAPAGAAAPGPPAPRLTWRHHRRILHEAAPFAVVRWTNLWFPGRFGLGDWFGGPVAGLFGAGIRDVEVRGNTSARRPARDGRQRRSRWLWLSGRLVPGFAHTRYFDFPDDTGPDSVTTALAAAIDLGWRSFPADPDPDPDQPPAVVAQRAGGGDS
jgi:hypothetical protein